MASPSAGAPALKYRDVNTVTPSPGEVKGLINFYYDFIIFNRDDNFDFFGPPGPFRIKIFIFFGNPGEGAQKNHNS